MSNLIGVRHVGLAAKNLAALAAFYRGATSSAWPGRSGCPPHRR
jgi:hypothetical protein